MKFIMILRSLLVVLLFMLINLSRSRKLLQFETENSKKKEDFIRDILQRQNLTDKHVKTVTYSNECLYPADKAKELIKDLKLSYVDENIRFILGSCNPVVLIPGVLGTRLVVNIKCEEFLKDKQKNAETKFFCGKKICQSSIFKQDFEEHVLWPALFESPFKLYEDGDNKNNTCFGYFMQYFNSPEECPKMKPDSTIDNEKYICRYHPAIKITYYGGTNKTESGSKCGLRGIENIVDSGEIFIRDDWVNSGASVGFYGINSRLQEMGYRPGFSLAGLPYDFRRFIKTNDDFTNKLFDIVNTLYRNTGKKVIVIGHSYGNLNVLNFLTQSNNLFKEKIKRFVAIAPPFIGAPKAVQSLTLGTHEFRTEIAGFIIDLNIIAQKLYSSITPSSYELMIKPHFEILKDKFEYEQFTSAIAERILLERKCEKDGCDNNYIKENSKYFNEIFKFFPKLDGAECSEDFKDPKYKLLEEYKKKKYQDILNLIPTYSKCKFRMFDYENCPVIIYSDNHDQDIKNYNNICYNKTKNENTFFVENCLKKDAKNKNKCLAEFIKSEGSFGYENLEISGIYETRQIHAENIEKFYKYQIENDQILDFPNPELPITLVYSSYLETATAYLYQKNNSKLEFNSSNIHFHGGDGTVPSISALFPGLKWAFEKYQNKTKNGIQFVEYCSIMNKDENYGYNKINEISNENHYIALGCECLDGDKLKLETFESNKKCSHATMINDKILIGFLENIISLDPQYDNIFKYNNNIRYALITYAIEGLNFEDICNKKLNK